MKNEKQKPRFFALTERWQVHVFLDKIKELIEEEKKRIAEEIENSEQPADCIVFNVIQNSRIIIEYQDLIESIENYLSQPDNEPLD